MSIKETIEGFCLRIADLVSDDDSRRNYDLSEADYKKLKRLTESDGWEVYCEVLDTAVRFQGEKIINAANPDMVEFRRGTAYGMRKAALLVHNLINQKEGKDARRQQHRESEQRRHGRTAGTDLYGTGKFRRWSRNGDE